jgi:hypothetical protein
MSNKKIESKYPIGQLLILQLKTSNRRLSDFITELGYRNCNKGLRAFYRVLSTGTSNQVLIERLMASPYAPPPEQLNEAINKTASLKSAETRGAHEAEMAQEREKFSPHIAPITELQQPTCITVFALLGGFDRMKVALPDDFLTWSLTVQYAVVQKEIREHYLHFKGEAPFLGAIVGYLLFRTYDSDPLSFSIDGQPLGRVPREKTLKRQVLIASRRQNNLHRLFGSQAKN